MVDAIEGLGAYTRVLVASIRDSSQLVDLAFRGCDTFTFSPEIAEALFVEPLTSSAAADFEAAASAMGGDAEAFPLPEV